MEYLVTALLIVAWGLFGWGIYMESADWRRDKKRKQADRAHLEEIRKINRSMDETARKLQSLNQQQPIFGAAIPRPGAALSPGSLNYLVENSFAQRSAKPTPPDVDAIPEQDEVITSWRGFQINMKLVIGAPPLLRGHYGQNWSGREYEATCNEGTLKECLTDEAWKRDKHEQHGCGLYSMKDAWDNNVINSAVAAECTNLGIVTEYEHGYRAERTRIERLWLFTEEDSDPDIVQGYVASLIKRYQVPVAFGTRNEFKKMTDRMRVEREIHKQMVEATRWLLSEPKSRLYELLRSQLPHLNENQLLRLSEWLSRFSKEFDWSAVTQIQMDRYAYPYAVCLIMLRDSTRLGHCMVPREILND